MVKDFLLVLVVFVIAISSCKDGDKKGESKGDNKTEQSIRNSADSMMTAFKSKDWQTFARFNHPQMIAMMGGHDNYIALIQDQMKVLQDSSIKKLKAGKILQVVKTPTDIQCIVEQNMLMHIEGMKIEATNYLIGESLDGGNKWTFFDASNGGMVRAKDIKPNLSPELKIPAKKQAVKKL